MSNMLGMAVEELACKALEAIRWPNGIVCPKCGSGDGVYELLSRDGTKRPARAGLRKCRACKRQFTVTVGTMLEDSHIPASKWLAAANAMNDDAKGVGASQLKRILDVTYKAAWSVVHRMRYAMATTGQGVSTSSLETDRKYASKLNLHGVGSENILKALLNTPLPGRTRVTRATNSKGMEKISKRRKEKGARKSRYVPRTRKIWHCERCGRRNEKDDQECWYCFTERPAQKTS